MNKTYTELLPCEREIRAVFGSQWRHLSYPDKDGAWGVAIVSSVLHGVSPNLSSLSAYLGVDRDTLRSAFHRLNMNGIFYRQAIEKDKDALLSGDCTAWCYYAGYASGDTGPWRDRPMER